MSFLPKISVIAPVYKVEPYIAGCIESVLSQTLSDWELILVDDCGNDNSMEIVKAYAKRDHRIKYIESNANVGPMMAREKGYQSSKGDYIAFIDSDDTLPNSALESLYRAAVAINADIVVGEAIQISAMGEESYYMPLNEYKLWGKKDVFRCLLKNKFPHTLWGKLFKGSLLRNSDIKSFKSFTNSEDAYLFYQMVRESNSIVTIKEVVYNYWMRPLSSTNKQLTVGAIDNFATFRIFQYELLEKELSDIEKDFYTSLYYEISSLAKRFPYKSIKHIYKKKGKNINMSFFNLLNYFSPFVAFKLFVKTHLYYFLKTKTLSFLCKE